MTLRWNDYILAEDDSRTTVEDLWRSGSTKGRVAYILGEGFDPRATVGVGRIIASGVASDLHLISIGLGTSSADELTQDLAAQNAAELDRLAAQTKVRRTRIALPQVEERSSAGLKLGRGIIESGILNGPDLIIVDVSALPSGIHFPLIAVILNQFDQGKLQSEFQVVACHNADLDEAIIETGLGSAAALAGFNRYSLEGSQAVRRTKVWAPVVGKGQGEALRLIYDQLEPDEVCPVLPFPSRWPRRADDLVLEHRQLLMDRIEIEPGNIIYADETNPFDLYRALSRLQQEYTEALKILGPVTVLLSTHASKLLSLGVLLAAYEHKLAVISEGATDYSLAPGVDLGALVQNNRLASVWLSGSPYQSGGTT